MSFILSDHSLFSIDTSFCLRQLFTNNYRHTKSYKATIRITVIIHTERSLSGSSRSMESL